MTKGNTHLAKQVLHGALIYLGLFFILFFFTNHIGTKLNWPFWLIPPFYALYISQLGANKKILSKLLKQRLVAVTILSFIGTSLPHVSFAFIILFALETLVALGRAGQNKQFPTALWSLLLLIVPLLYLIITRMYNAGLLGWVVTGIAFVVLATYWFMKRSGMFKRLFIPK